MSIELRRNLKGCAHPKAKLQPGDDECIRARYLAGETQRALAREYHVHQRTVFRIVSGQSYSAD